MQWDRLAEIVDKPVTTLQEEAALAWVLAELAAVDRGIAEYVRRYGVQSPEELENAVVSNAVQAHPAWEDLIDWHNLLAYRSKVLSAISPHSTGETVSVR